MSSSVKTAAGTLLTCVVALAWLAAPGAAQADRTASRAPEPPAAAQSSQASYVGEDTCLTCHPGQARGYRGSAHGRLSNARSPIANLGCENCHGPGKAHADSSDKTKIKRFTSGMAAADIDAQCLQCHATGDRASWEGSRHDAANVSCVKCHSIHAAKSTDALLKTERQAEDCEQCHRAQVQKLRRSSHMPVDEGSLECSSCHNPHGTTGVKLLRGGSTVNESCEKCHAEKRGPFLWEHAPVVENCTTCHDPHGSTNDRMLVAKEPFLCQRCHVSSQHPPTVYDGYALTNSPFSNRMIGRSCAACHQNIHGSNAPSGKAFLR